MLQHSMGEMLRGYSLSCRGLCMSSMCRRFSGAGFPGTGLQQDFSRHTVRLTCGWDGDVFSWSLWEGRCVQRGEKEEAAYMLLLSHAWWELAWWAL